VVCGDGPDYQFVCGVGVRSGDRSLVALDSSYADPCRSCVGAVECSEAAIFVIV
jgi:hypothetical protein